MSCCKSESSCSGSCGSSSLEKVSAEDLIKEVEHRKGEIFKCRSEFYKKHVHGRWRLMWFASLAWLASVGMWSNHTQPMLTRVLVLLPLAMLCFAIYKDYCIEKKFHKEHPDAYLFLGH